MRQRLRTPWSRGSRDDDDEAPRRRPIVRVEHVDDRPSCGTPGCTEKTAPSLHFCAWCSSKLPGDLLIRVRAPDPGTRAAAIAAGNEIIKRKRGAPRWARDT